MLVRDEYFCSVSFPSYGFAIPVGDCIGRNDHLLDPSDGAAILRSRGEFDQATFELLYPRKNIRASFHDRFPCVGRAAACLL